MIEHHPITDRASWLAKRTQDLTASDFAAAIGESPYKTALELYAEKTGVILPEPETAVMRRGRLLEPVAVAMLAEEHPDWAIEYPLNLYIRDASIRLGATPDAKATIDGKLVNLQIKTANRLSYERDWANGPPDHIIYQTAVEGMLLDADRSIIVLLIVDYASFNLMEFPVERHPEAEARFRQDAIAFWDNIASGRLPAADLSRDAKTLAALFPQSVKEPVLDLSQYNALPGELKEWARLRDEVAERKERMDRIETGIKEKLGPAEIAELPGWRITWRTTTIKEHFRKETSFRRLHVSEIKQQEEDKAA